MSQPITNISVFGEYKNAEDRVTAALLKIFQVGGSPVIHAVFSNILDLPSSESTIISQYFAGNSRPDGKISCNCNYEIIIESKVVQNAIRQNQLEAHRSYSCSVSSYLVYITPDTTCPEALSSYGVSWISWSEVLSRLLEIASSQAVDAVLLFLIGEFKILLEHILIAAKNRIPVSELQEPNLEKILQEEASKRVIIVGGHKGESVAKEYEFYVCQPHRFFLPAKYIAFYHQNRIKYLFEIVGEPIEEVDIKSIDAVSNTDYFTKVEPNYNGEMRKYMKLKLGKEFKHEIRNNKKDHNGNSCAFLQKQTYTTYDKITKARHTSDL